MKFYANNYYMHTSCRDTCIFVLKNQYQDEKRATLKVQYVNLGYTGKPVNILQKNSYIIKAEEYNNWIRIDANKVLIPRTKDGLP